ncbi:MAG: gas vesicle structural protein GvpA [Actinobacteria bacterium]|nr:gas vesicle structural protein GvpA [Actinomycetota bacterium]
MSSTAIARRPNSGSLYDVVDVILDKGLVIDAFVRVSLVGIELLTVDARIVVASVDTYLHFAEAVDRLDLTGRSEPKTLPDLFGDTSEEVSKSKTKGALEGGIDKIKETFGSEGDEEKQKQKSKSS